MNEESEFTPTGAKKQSLLWLPCPTHDDLVGDVRAFQDSKTEYSVQTYNSAFYLCTGFSNNFGVRRLALGGKLKYRYNST